MVDFQQAQDIVEYGLMIIGLASAVSPIIPSPKYNKYLIVAKAVLDVFAFNFGHARNKTPVDPVKDEQK